MSGSGSSRRRLVVRLRQHALLVEVPKYPPDDVGFFHRRRNAKSTTATKTRLDIESMLEALHSTRFSARIIGAEFAGNSPFSAAETHINQFVGIPTGRGPGHRAKRRLNALIPKTKEASVAFCFSGQIGARILRKICASSASILVPVDYLLIVTIWQPGVRSDKACRPCLSGFPILWSSKM